MAEPIQTQIKISTVNKKKIRKRKTWMMKMSMMRMKHGLMSKKQKKMCLENRRMLQFKAILPNNYRKNNK
jgi:hypothetical protein